MANSDQGDAVLHQCGDPQPSRGAVRRGGIGYCGAVPPTGLALNSYSCCCMRKPASDADLAILTFYFYHLDRDVNNAFHCPELWTPLRANAILADVFRGSVVLFVW